MIKVAFIGAGSLTFTRGLFRDILTVPELRNTHFAFMDINRRYLDMAAELCRKDIQKNNFAATVSATTDRRKAIEGADYIISAVRIGGLEAFATDIEIPLKYGIDQCVGDTLCAGGIMYGQRNIAFMKELCRDIREVAKKDALFLNYANPNAMNTWAANHHFGVRTLGLCHGVYGGHCQIVSVISLLVNGDKKKGDKGFVTITEKDVDIICAGINHQTWYIQVLYKGKDWTGRLLEGFQRHPQYAVQEKVRIDMLKRFGYYSTESNGHLSEYVAWYRKRAKDIGKWIELSSWINGETGGYLRACTEGRNWFQRDYAKLLRTAGQPIVPEQRSHEHGSYIIESLETGRPYRGHFNVVNNGCITNLPDDAIVEVPCYVDRNGIGIPQVGPLPLGCAAVCNASISVQRLAVEAAVCGDATLLKQAMMMDPLTGAVCDPEEISQLTDEMLVAQTKWLPQYRKAIPDARRRLAHARRMGEYKGTGSTEGAARLQSKSGKALAAAWATVHGARVLESYRVSALQPAVADIRKLALPVGINYSKRIETVMAGGADGFADIRAIHGNQDGIIFLRASHTSASATAGALYYGADGPVKVWINGAVADCRPSATNPAIAGQFQKKVMWRKGVNDIVFALSSNRGAAWGLFAAVARRQ